MTTLPPSLQLLPTETRQPWQGLWTCPWPAEARLTADGILFLPWAPTLCRRVDRAPGLLIARQANRRGDICTSLCQGPASTHITPFVGGREKLTSQQLNSHKVSLYVKFKAGDVRYYQVRFCTAPGKESKRLHTYHHGVGGRSESQRKPRR